MEEWPCNEAASAMQIRQADRNSAQMIENSLIIILPVVFETDLRFAYNNLSECELPNARFEKRFIKY
jgi:hypothetical protein